MRLRMKIDIYLNQISRLESMLSNGNKHTTVKVVSVFWLSADYVQR